MYEVGADGLMTNSGSPVSPYSHILALVQKLRALYHGQCVAFNVLMKFEELDMLFDLKRLYSQKPRQTGHSPICRCVVRVKGRPTAGPSGLPSMSLTTPNAAFVVETR
jgi:hypothetical protein